MKDRPLDISDYGTYDPHTIKVLETHEYIRLRPAMCIGSDFNLGLIYLVAYVVDAFLAYDATRIDITLHAGNGVTVTDNGSGFPTEPITMAKTMPMASAMFTYLLVGRKGRVHLVFPNALSQQLELKIWRDGYLWEQSFRQGVAQNELHQSGASARHGNSIRFVPDSAIFSGLEYDFDKLVEWFRICSSLSEQTLSEPEPEQGGFHMQTFQHLAAFRNTHFTFIDERPAANGEVRCVSFGPE